MGASFGCANALEFPEGPSRVQWQVPVLKERSGGVSTPTAGREFATGECVEKAYCLGIKESEEIGFLEQYCYPAPDAASESKLLIPLGWGLLYARSSTDANLVAEYSWEPPPPPPLPEEANEITFPTKPSKPSEPCHWLTFRAIRPIRCGDALLVKPPSAGSVGSATIPIFDAAAEALHEDRFALENFFDDPCNHAYHLSLETPPTIDLFDPAGSAIVIGGSPIHGLGVFAARDIQEGEMIEVTPTLPVYGSDFEGNIMADYSFESGYSKGDDIECFHMGFGAIYNDSDSPNVSHYRFHDSPYVEAWIADKFIAQGEEICHDYSKAYFDTRDYERKTSGTKWYRKKLKCYLI